MTPDDQFVADSIDKRVQAGFYTRDDLEQMVADIVDDDCDAGEWTSLIHDAGTADTVHVCHMCETAYNIRRYNLNIQAFPRSVRKGLPWIPICPQYRFPPPRPRRPCRCIPSS